MPKPYLCAVFALLSASHLDGETGYRGWLRYAHLDETKARDERKYLPTAVVPLGGSLLIRSAQQELSRGLSEMLGQTLQVGSLVPSGSAFVLGSNPYMVEQSS